MKILTVSDSFKGSLSSNRIGQIVQEELQTDHEVDFLPISDGGEGFIESWQEILKGSVIVQRVPDPLLREIESSFILTNQNTALIESARICGLDLLQDGERNPLQTSTYGLGKMILVAIHKGAKEIYIGLGGSATNDGGMGLLQALGVKLLDSRSHEIGVTGGRGLSKVQAIDPGNLSELTQKVKFFGICDVQNPLLGPEGATLVFGPQKGGGPEAISILEEGMHHFAEISNSTIGKDFSSLPGTGAAGGLGFCLRAYLQAELLPGMEATINLTRLEEKVSNFDLIITGEGRIDTQSIAGKVPWGILDLGQQAKKPVICLCGQNDLPGENGFEKIFSVVPDVATLTESIKYPERYLRTLIQKRLIKWLKVR